MLYYYSLVKPESIILSKIIYYSLLMMGLSLIGLFFYSMVMGNPVNDLAMFLLTIVLASFGLATALTMLSGIASKASNSSTLIAVLSFPVIIPMLLLIIRCSKNALDGIERSVYTDQLLTLIAINAIVVAVSYLLFPYLWRS